MVVAVVLLALWFVIRRGSRINHPSDDLAVAAVDTYTVALGDTKSDGGVGISLCMYSLDRPEPIRHSLVQDREALDQ